ncbi:MAG TPA: PKD domain-containing protein, partial [Phycisphaerae bacterium]|nr:PKD domain-containing protein [Phycisphaerae bacterium]
MRLYSIAVLVGLTASGVIGQVGGCGSGPVDPLNPFESPSPIEAESESGDLRIVAELFDPDDPLTVHFRAEAVDGSSLVDDSVTWMFGDDTTDIGAEVIHTYAAEGDYYVQVTTDLAASKTASVTGVLLPIRTFKVRVESVPAVGEAPLTVQLSIDTSAPLAQEVATYRWNFDDGQVAEGDQSTEHIFQQPGRYKVRATVVTNAGWSRSGSVTVNVSVAGNSSPEAVIDAWPLAGQAPLTVLFDGSGSSDGDGEVVSYVWQFGDGQSAGGPVVEHTYPNEGDYSATLTVIDDGGASNTAEVIVSVEAADPGPNQLPTAAISADPTAGTAPLTVALSASGSTDPDGVINSYLWDFGDGVSGAGVEATHTYTDAGDYMIVLTVIDNDGGMGRAEVVIHVNVGPTASFVMDPQRDVAPVVVHFSAAASTDADGQISHYYWDFGDGAVEQGPDKVTVDHAYAAGGTYVVRLTVTDNDGLTGRDTGWLALSELAVTPPSVDFGDTGSQESIEVGNPGACELQYNVVVDYGLGPDGWLSVNPAAGSCAAGQTTALTVEDDRAMLPAGTHSAEIQVRAGDVTRTVGVTIAVVAVATSIDRHDFGIDSSVCQFEVWNDGAGVLTYEVASKPEWVEVSGAPGTSSGPQDSKTVTLTVDRSGLAPGEHTGDLVLSPASGQGDLSQTIALTTSVPYGAGSLSVTPANGLSSSGSVGGPFSPGSVSYTLTNSGAAAVDWTVGKSANWVSLSGTGGSLSPGASFTVVVTINSQANSLTGGTYNDTVTFTNVTNGAGNTTRGVSLTVNTGSAGAMTTASRTSGIAPLAVFFDAVDPASGVIQPADGDYASLGYAWDFGDPDAGTWSTNGNSRNTAMGYVAAHVYEQPGTYTATLTVTDTQGGT